MKLKNQVYYLEKLHRFLESDDITGLISWMDNRIIKSYRETNADGYPREDSGHIILAIFSTKLLEELVKKENLHAQNLLATISAGNAYLQDPNANTWDFFFNAATQSYPYGPGEGCHCVGKNDHSKGSGCISGAGNIFQLFNALKKTDVNPVDCMKKILEMQF